MVIKQKAAAFSYANELTPPYALWKPLEPFTFTHNFFGKFYDHEYDLWIHGIFSTFLSFFFKFFKGHKQFANDRKSALLFGVWGIDFIGLMMHNKMMPAIRNQ